MKKHYLLNLFLLFSLQCATAQTAFYDALDLYEKVNKEGKVKVSDESVVPILAANMPAKSELEMDNILNRYKDNPFIAPYLDFSTRPDPGLLADLCTDCNRGIGGGGNAGIGFGMPASTFLLGLTDFLVKRAKQEMSISFFKTLQEKMEESQELQLIFPNTAGVLRTIGEDVYKIKSFWKVLQEGFISDFGDMPKNLSHYSQESTHIQNENVRDMMSDCFLIVDMLQNETTPPKVLEYLATDAYIQDSQEDKDPVFTVIRQNFKLLGLLSHSLEDVRGNKNKNMWISAEDFRMMIRDSIRTDFYLGFVYEKGKDISIGEKTLGDYMQHIAGNNENKRHFVRTLRGFLDKGQNLATIATKIKAAKRDRKSRYNRNKDENTQVNSSLLFEDYYKFADGVVEMIEYGYELKMELLPSENKVDSMFLHYVSITRDVNKMILDIGQKRYASAVINLLLVVKKILPADQFGCEQKVLLKYATFIATAATAKSAEDVTRAIQLFALPPGSATIKKYSKFSIALNAYVGLAAGQEQLRGVGGSAFYAVTTPVGVSFNWGFENAGSISLFASVLDLGALTAFRFAGTDSVGLAQQQNPLPDLKFENVLAPGGYIIYGVPKFPLSIGIGAQLGPNLRTVSVNGINTTTSGFRWGAFIAVDIPLVSVFSTNKRYKNCVPRLKKNKKKPKKKMAE